MCLAVLVLDSKHLQASARTMALLKLALFALLAVPALGERRLRGDQVERDQRSLTNTFPFNQKAGLRSTTKSTMKSTMDTMRHLSLPPETAGRVLVWM